MERKDRRIEIEPAPVDVDVEFGDGLPRAQARGELPALTDEQIRETLEATRR